MKKFVTLSVAAMLAFSMTACGPKEKPATESPAPAVEAPATEAPAPAPAAEAPAPAPAESSSALADGVYKAEQANFDEQTGYKDNVTVTVAGGKITAVDWNATHKDGKDDKKTASQNGGYDMKAAGAKSDWYVQAKSMEDEVIKTQDPKAIALTAEGKTDAVTGVSIHVKDFLGLVETAIANGPVGGATAPSAEAPAAGAYKDGTYIAEQADFDPQTGYKDNITIAVAGGKITSVNWNATHKDGKDDKKTASQNGGYDMKVAGAKSDWHVQAKTMEDELIKTQDPKAIALTAEGKTDAVTGVSIHVNGFVALAEEALATAK